MTTYDAVIYDLDGTLVRLNVDWAACESALRDRLTEAGVTTENGTAWTLLEAAEQAGIGNEAASIIATYERQGAEGAVRLPTAEEASNQAVPIGVCSLNCEAACRIALERVGLLDTVEVIIGRDSHPERKPAPGPLLAALEAVGVAPERAVFVGDSASDRTTAERAGTAFKPVADGHTNR